MCARCVCVCECVCGRCVCVCVSVCVAVVCVSVCAIKLPSQLKSRTHTITNRVDFTDGDHEEIAAMMSEIVNFTEAQDASAEVSHDLSDKANNNNNNGDDDHKIDVSTFKWV